MTVLKRTIITVIIVVTSAIMVLIAYSTNYKTQPSEPKQKSKAIMQTIEYTIKEHNGKIAVFEGNNTEPLMILDSPYIRDLPKSDQELLLKGIVARNKAELNKVLEDYDN